MDPTSNICQDLILRELGGVPFRKRRHRVMPSDGTDDKTIIPPGSHPRANTNLTRLTQKIMSKIVCSNKRQFVNASSALSASSDKPLITQVYKKQIFLCVKLRIIHYCIFPFTFRVRSFMRTASFFSATV